MAERSVTGAETPAVDPSGTTREIPTPSHRTPSVWNLLFTNVLLITIPPLVMFMFFNRQIVAGLSSGAVKGQVSTGSSAPPAR